MIVTFFEKYSISNWKYVKKTKEVDRNLRKNKKSKHSKHSFIYSCTMMKLMIFTQIDKRDEKNTDSSV
jgi:hypothetical protein